MGLLLGLLCSSYSNSQTIDYTTGNLINYSSSPTDTTSTWNNGVYVNQLTCWYGGDPGNCGPNPSVRPGGFINFSYGTTDLNQVISINTALAAAQTGIKVSGFYFGFMAKNGNGWDDARQDYLSAYVKFYSAAGNLVENYDYTNKTNQQYNWTAFNFNETFTNAYTPTTLSTAKVGFIGRDNNGWAGTYGPEVYNVSFALKYSVDPCATNPAYSSSCAGFSNVITSSNLVPNSTGYAAYGGSINNSYGIQVALQNSGTGLTVHGFDYGYNVYAAQSYCAFEVIWCFDWRQGGSASVTAGITKASGDPLYTITRNYNESGYSPQNFQYRFPSSLNQMQLGSFNFTASTYGDAYVGDMYSKMVYSQDPCYFNPNYSTQCTNKPLAPAAPPPPTADQMFGSPTLNVGGVQLSSTGTISAPTGLPPPPPGSEPPPGSPPPPPGSPPPPPGSPPPPPGSPPPPSGSPANQNSTVPGPATATAKAGPNMSLVMSTISNIQAADKATQNAAVQNAQQVVTTSSAAAQAQAFQVVEQLNTMSAASSQASQQLAGSSSVTQQLQQSSSSTVALQGPTVLSAQTLSAMAVQSAQTAMQSQAVQSSYSNPSAASTYSLTSSITGKTSFGLSVNTQSNNVTAMYIPPTQTIQQAVPQLRYDSRSLDQDNSIMQPSVAMTRGSLINDLLEAKTNVNTNQAEQKDETVKKNVQANELAGGVDVASIAQVPKGYEAYSVVTLRDVPFYKPEAIYKNNRTVDNANVFRGLTGGSDAKHQQMVDQQYKLGE